MIDFDAFTFTYPDSAAPVLSGIDLHVDEGELCLVIGPTGTGKTTLLAAVNGLVPHFTGGRLSGRVVVAGRDTATHPPRRLADIVGYVAQDPLSGFVTDNVEEELAYGMEQLAVPADVMRRRVEEHLDLLGLADLRHRPLRQLSGGQQQRVAIASVLTAHPRVLVLDEPTSALDPTAAEEVLAAITRIVHDLGVTVLLAEHRLERVVQYADRVVVVHGDGSLTAGAPTAVLATSPVAPPVVELGRLAGWDPLPLSVRDARRAAVGLRARLTAPSALPPRPPPPLADDVTAGPQPPGPAPVALTARHVGVSFGPTPAVRSADLQLRAGETVALMGRNGSGKSSLLWALQGSGRRQRGRVDVAGHDPASLPALAARRLVGLVPQTPADLLYLPTVDAELRQADRETGHHGTARALLDRVAPGIPGDADPRDLSEGQRLSLVLAVQLGAAPPVLLLDEPTRGLDYGAKRALGAVVAELAAEGRSVVIATHDVEWVAAVADRVVVLAEGDVVSDAPVRPALSASPAFAPQVAKILSPLELLTVDEVADAIADARSAAGVVTGGAS